jgi:hypothetical protein
MTGVFLQNELQSIIQESKRKSPGTRTAAEKSLADLKSLSVTSESQLSGDLLRKPQFIEPFVLACRSRNVKLATTGTSCLQRLAAGRAIPQERLSDVLDALREVAAVSLDIQLKILQTLPSLLQLYSSDIRGALLAAALEICDTLQGSKTAVVSSTAEATFQQLVTTVYDRVATEDCQASEEGSLSVQIGNETVALRPAAHDAFRVFADLCAMANAAQPVFVQLKTLSPHFLLEVIGSIAANYSSILAQHAEQLEVCRSSLLPALNKVIATKSTFAVLVRALRILYVLLRQHLKEMVVHFEDALLSMISLLEPNSGQPWRRVLSMEVFRGLFSDASLFRDLYGLYDDAEDRKNVVESLLAAFVRIASEDPTLIGLGRQSTMPSQHGDASNGDGITSFEVSDIGGAVGGVVSASATVTGLSTVWSTVKVPCLEQLDKSNLSDVPTTYIYSLVLNCMSALAEGLSRFVMPLSVPSKVYLQRTKPTKDDDNGTVDRDSHPVPAQSMSTHDQSRLINPLTITGHPQIEELLSCARMIDNCWPPILATCSTFFNAALDAEYYHNLVRAFQKLTQVSGVLELSTARDALLTTLSKAAVPTSTNIRLFSPSVKQNSAAEDAAAIDAATAQTTQSAGPRDFGQPRLSIRNLLCLRALLNLGIALGPSLGTDAWFIILRTLQRAEYLLSSAGTLPGGDGSQTEERPTEQGGTRTLFGTEIAAVQTATKRMLESTNSYTDETFALFVTSLFMLGPAQDDPGASNAFLSPTSPAGTPSRAQMHRANRSVSAVSTNSETLAGDQEFVIFKVSQLARTNMHRFLSPGSIACSWQLLIQKLLDIFASQQASTPNRLKSAEEIDTVVLEVVKAFEHQDEEGDSNTVILRHCFNALTAQLRTIQDDTGFSEAGLNLRHESHTKLLGILEVIIGHCGDTLTQEWTNVLKLISSAFVLDGEEEDASDASEEDHRIIPTTARSEAILQRSFSCLHLLVSDFLVTLRSVDLTELTKILFLFGSQNVVLNISLTATTFFWNVATLLLENLRSTATSSGPNATHEKSTMIETRSTFLLLFSRMSLLSLDGRSDVRQSSTRVTTKVLEAASDQLSPLALNTSISRLLVLCSSQVKRCGEGTKDTTGSWQEAAIQTLRGATETATQNMQKIRAANNFADTWKAYVQVCNSMLDQETLSMSCAAYKGLTTMLQSLAEDDGDGQLERSESVLQTCLDHHPADIDPGRESNQAALTQYAMTFAAVFGVGSDLIAKPKEVLKAVERTVLECVHPPYTSDTKTLAPEQAAVVDLFPQLQRLLPGSAYTDLLQSFIKAPIAPAESCTNATFVALAARCSELMRATVMTALERDSGTTDVVPMLETLSKLIATKYTALPQGGAPSLWHNATMSAVQISQSAMKSAPSIRDLPRMTAAFTSLTTSILQAGGLGTAHGLDLTDDEVFDISSVAALHAAINPEIGDDRVPTVLLKSYVLTLFHASLVAEPFSFDLPADMIETPLENFATVRPGTVCDPVYAKRDRICYTALDTLFSLVARRSEMRPEARRLAQAAAPYLLLRCAYSFKTFIADQPLRSISALPQLLRLEMLTILNKCIELRCAKEAFTGIAKGDNSDGKDHLRLLNGLVVRLEGSWQRLPRKATGVNWQDRKDGKEIEDALARWRASLAEGWEIIT